MSHSTKKPLFFRSLALVAVCLAGLLLLAQPAAPAKAASKDKAITKKVDAILKKQVKKKDTKKAKLKKLFRYVEKTYGYARAVGFQNKKGWEKEFALEMYADKKGSCYHFAAAYAFLAKKATGYKVRIGIGQTNGFGNDNQPHAWTEVKIGSKWYVCDTNMDKFAAKSSLKYFLKERKKVKKAYYNFQKSRTVYVTI